LYLKCTILNTLLFPHTQIWKNLPDSAMKYCQQHIRPQKQLEETGQSIYRHLIQALWITEVTMIVWFLPHSPQQTLAHLIHSLCDTLLNHTEVCRQQKNERHTHRSLHHNVAMCHLIEPSQHHFSGTAATSISIFPYKTQTDQFVNSMLYSH